MEEDIWGQMQVILYNQQQYVNMYNFFGTFFIIFFFIMSLKGVVTKNESDMNLLYSIIIIITLEKLEVLEYLGLCRPLILYKSQMQFNI
jgi:hypothetical protein